MSCHGGGGGGVGHWILTSCHGGGGGGVVTGF